MGLPRIVLCGVSPKLQGLRWESSTLLRIGRQGNVDIVLDDPSVSRRHAEVFTTGKRWLVRDLARQDNHPTLLNGVRVTGSGCKLQPDDVLQCGNLAMKVDTLEVAQLSSPCVPPPERPLCTAERLRTSGSFVRVEATAQHSWDQALEVAARTRAADARQEQHFLTLLRTGHHLGHIASLDELLESVLTDAVRALDAQRGSILLENPATGKLELRTVLAPGLAPRSQRCYSTTLAQRCFAQGASLLCRNAQAEAELLAAQSIQQGAMHSLICALLRSPRKRIGVLQLDRGPMQDAFGEDDFYLADAIAASVAVGIECAQLVEAQRDQFVQTVTSLARAVEVRDQYTGDHTRRVLEYSLLLADELNISAAERYQIQIGAPLHDIGKIGVNDAILRKPGQLTPAEFEQMKQHTVLGGTILQSILNLAPMIPIVRHHHERWDGKGYPDNLAGEKIPQTARIVAVADAFDAMTSTRPYRPAMSVAGAFEELVRKSGSHFDPSCVEAFLRLRPHIEGQLGQP